MWVPGHLVQMIMYQQATVPQQLQGQTAKLLLEDQIKFSDAVGQDGQVSLSLFLPPFLGKQKFFGGAFDYYCWNNYVNN